MGCLFHHAAVQAVAASGAQPAPSEAPEHLVCVLWAAALWRLPGCLVTVVLLSRRSLRRCPLRLIRLFVVVVGGSAHLVDTRGPIRELCNKQLPRTLDVVCLRQERSRALDMACRHAHRSRPRSQQSRGDRQHEEEARRHRESDARVAQWSFSWG